MIGHNQTSIFQRDNTDSVPMGNVVAVWGSPSCGKTTVSAKLAHYLASRKKNVILLLCDMVSPPMPCLCNPADLVEEHSLGDILGAAHVTQALIKENCTFHKKYKYLTIIGMKKGENVFTYPLVHDFKQIEIQRLKAKALMIPLKIRKYSFMMLMCFTVTYLFIIAFDIIRSMGTMM